MKNIKLRKARRTLTNLYGFKFHKHSLIPATSTGFCEAEKVDTGKDHFSPLFRSVTLIKSIHGGYCISSGVKGKMRRYRCRNENEIELKKVVVSGPNLQDALEKFISKFNAEVSN